MSTPTLPNKTDVSIPMEQAATQSLIFAVPPAALIVALYWLVWGGEAFRAGFNAIFDNFFVFLALFVGGIILHEWIHGLAWMIFGGKPFSAIKFGFQWKSLTPYAHCTETLEINAYRMGTVMPFLLLGLVPAAISIALGNGFLMGFGIIFSVAASGDLLILWIIRNVPAGKLVEDHPENAGCMVID